MSAQLQLVPTWNLDPLPASDQPSVAYLLVDIVQDLAETSDGDAQPSNANLQLATRNSQLITHNSYDVTHRL